MPTYCAIVQEKFHKVLHYKPCNFILSLTVSSIFYHKHNILKLSTYFHTKVTNSKSLHPVTQILLLLRKKDALFTTMKLITNDITSINLYKIIFQQYHQLSF
jgi:hypothetical protein